MEQLLTTVINSCPKCGNNKYEYHKLTDRHKYKGEIITGKYTCIKCGWQSGINGEMQDK